MWKNDNLGLLAIIGSLMFGFFSFLLIRVLQMIEKRTDKGIGKRTVVRIFTELRDELKSDPRYKDFDELFSRPRVRSQTLAFLLLLEPDAIVSYRLVPTKKESATHLYVRFGHSTYGSDYALDFRSRKIHDACDCDSVFLTLGFCESLK